MTFLTSQTRRTGAALRSRRGGNLVAGIVGASLLAITGIGYVGFVLWPRHLSEVPPDAPSVPIIVAGVVFNVPPAAIRQQVQRRSGAQDRIDLVFLWPSLEPPQAGRQPHAPADEPQPQPLDRLFVTIAGSDGTLPPAERMKMIYPRYTSGELRPEQDGLMVRQFGDGTPYKGEDLVFDPSAPERFVARCSHPDIPPCTSLS